MSGSDGIDRSVIERLLVLIGGAGRNLLATIGSLLTITGFVALITSESIRDFIKRHPYPIYILLVLTTLALLATLNYAVAVHSQNRRLRKLSTRIAELRPSTHDLRLFADLLRDLPDDGSILYWLRRTNVTELEPTDFSADVLSALDKIAAHTGMHPVGFDNAEVAGAMRTFVAAISAFRAAVENWTLIRGAPPWRGTTVPGPAATDSVLDALVTSHRELLRAYDAVMITAHRHGIDVS